jgi:hypothetical protein
MIDIIQYCGGVCDFIPLEYHLAMMPIMAALFIILLGVPIARVIHRSGHSRWWTIVAFLPFLNLIGLWVLAFVRWPTTEKAAT